MLILPALLCLLPASLIPAEPAAVPRAQEVAPAGPTEAAPEWFEGSFDELFAKAKEERRPVFLHFWAKWSYRTQVLYGKVLQTPEAEAELAGYLCYSVDVMSDEGKPIAARFNAVRPPRLIFFDADGAPVDLIGDISNPVWMTTEAFVAEAARIHAGVGTIPALRAEIAEKPEDPDLRFALALKLRLLGDGVGFAEQVAEIRKLDPEGTSLPLRTLELEKLSATISDPKVSPGRKDKAAEELRAFIERESDRALTFEAWKTLGTHHSQTARMAKQRYDHEQARKLAPLYVECWRQALPFATETDLEQLGPYVSIMIFELRDYLKEPDKAFALEITSGLREKRPDDVDLMDAHACALYMNGQGDEALALLRRAQSIDPSNWILPERIKAFQQGQ